LQDRDLRVSMKSKQYCSVCKQWLDMEVVSSGDPEDDDGVTWFRCPGCQGFLPKLNAGAEPQDSVSSSLENTSDADSAQATEPVVAASVADGDPAAEDSTELPWDSPQDMLEAAEATSVAEVSATMSDLEIGPEDDIPEVAKGSEGKAPSEPIAEYAAMLAEVDAEAAVPYRPWKTYEVGQCILHLAWGDCGVVVSKEALPGGRQVIKAYFADAGVVRLIENAPR